MKYGIGTLQTSVYGVKIMQLLFDNPVTEFMNLKKGDQTFLTGVWTIKAVIIEVLTPTRALVRVMEGTLAGDEIEADFDKGVLDYAQPH
ncbi:hypothetical protein ACELLULO517_25280 [Acidisoma cellulosilytica]|uniref:Uncharacterized protein n=1 Tax=Acidisoma cellulosilyticum TaxID=2802395 RepID=A0A963Z6U7_9PROT|nr:hypothetical protein [Acidisoma cellulosilyticum]MCB8883586.1 hypothetical protein [Acidisoma cellulosilyticum]